MRYGELYIQKQIERNPKNGRFLKGSTPWNKGKKWEEIFDKKTREYILNNLGKYRTGNPHIGGNNAIRVVAIKDGKLCGVFDSSNDAMRKTGICARNIRSVCSGKRKTAGGYKWYYEKDTEWIELINK